MLKKILCLALAALLVLPVFVACNRGNDSPMQEASEQTRTLNMWLITESQLVADASKTILSGLTPNIAEDKLTAEQKAIVDAMSETQKSAWQQVYAVSEAFNKITKSLYKVKVNLKYYTEDEYYAALEAAFLEFDKVGLPKLDEVGAGETEVNEYGVPVLKYPAANAHATDIIYIGDYSKYVSYLDDGRLVSLTARLEDTVLPLVSKMNNNLLNAVQREGQIYALPNNHAIGEYVYLIADKELLSDYGDLSGSTIYDTSFQTYLDYIYAKQAAGEDIYPIYSETGKVELDYAHYWSFDVDSSEHAVVQKPGDFFLFGDLAGGKATIMGNNTGKTMLANDNVLTNLNYMKHLATKTYYENTGNYLTTDPEAKAAVRIVRGGYEMRAKYEAEGYQVLTMQYPQLTDEEACSSMFAVGVAKVDDFKSTQIITALNTNQELQNILLYGVVNENYVFETTEVNGKEYQYVTPTENNLYKMDANRTGNQLLAYPDSPDKVLASVYGEEQNLQSVVYPTLSLDLDLKENKIDKDSIRIVAAVSAALEKHLSEKVKTYSDVMALYTLASSYKNDNVKMAEFLLGLFDEEVKCTVKGAEIVVTVEILTDAIVSLRRTEMGKADALQSPYAIYRAWCNENGLNPNA